MRFSCDKCSARYTISDEKVQGKLLKIRCKTCGNVIEVRDPAMSAPSQGAAPASASQGALKAQRRRPAQPVRPTVRPVSEPVATAAPRGEVKRVGVAATSSAPLASPQKSAAPRSSAQPSAPLGSPKRGAAPRPLAQPSAPLASAKTKATAEPRASVGLRSDVSAALRDPLGERASKTGDPAHRAFDQAGAPGKPELSDKTRVATLPWDDGVAVWYLGDDRGEYGPMTFSELAARVRRGEPGPSAEVWKEGMDDWLPIGDVPELQPYLKRAPPRRTHTGVRSAPASPYQKRPELDPAQPSVSQPVAAAPGVVVQKIKAEADELREELARLKPPVPAKVDTSGEALARGVSPPPAASSSPPSQPVSVAQAREDDFFGVPEALAPAAPTVPTAAPASVGAFGSAAASGREGSWPGVPEAASAPAARQEVDVFSLPVGVAPPPDGAGAAGLGPLPAAHVSMRAASDLGSLLVQEQKAARRPILLISLAALVVAAAAVILVVWIISSGRTSKESGGGQELAQGPPPPAEREGPRPGSESQGSLTSPDREAAPTGDMDPEVQELPELDIDVSLGMDTPRAPSAPMARLTQGAMAAASSSTAPAPTSGDSRASPTYGTPSLPMLAAIMAIGDSERGGVSGVGGGHGAPSDLGSVVRRNYNTLKRCYENAARMDSRLKDPRLTLSIQVSSSGRVKTVSVSPDKHASDNLGLCVRRVIMAWQFPSHGSDYRYAFSARFHGG